MAPVPSARVPCGEEEEEEDIPESAVADGNFTERQVLDMVTDLGARAVRNSSLNYYNLMEGFNTTEYAQGRIPRAFYDEDLIAADNCLYPNGIWVSGNMTNSSSPEVDYSDQMPPSISRLHEFQIIKAVVLAAVTVVILISICKMVFQLFVRYTVKHDK
jgi:hypothetical protein